jgi:hypothetical protein
MLPKALALLNDSGPYPNLTDSILALPKALALLNDSGPYPNLSDSILALSLAFKYNDKPFPASLSDNISLSFHL